MQAKADDTTAARGREAEEWAARLLAAGGLRIIERNFRVRGGEIDLICREGPTLVFVEVRRRTHQSFGGAAASIDARKQARLILAARHYLLRQPDTPCRFDCVLFDGDVPERGQWLKDAFRVDDAF